MDYQDAVKLCTNAAANFTVPVGTIKRCFGMSKMTNRDAAHSRAVETRLYFVEFLEFVGRIAVEYWNYFPDTETIPLAQKVEFVIDQLLPTIGLYRNWVPRVEESESESDDDY